MKTLASRIADIGIAGSVREQVPLAPLTTYAIGGPAEVIVGPACVEDVCRVVSATRGMGVRLTVLGGGSNVLVPDGGIEGVVLHVGPGLAGVDVRGDVVTAGAGTPDRALADAVARAGMPGFESLEDIPGTVGGAVIQNAEAFGQAVSDHLVEVAAVDVSGEIRRFRKADVEFGYRDSTFKRAGDLVVVEVVFRQDDRDDPTRIRERTDALRARRHSRYPLDLPSCGSVFKRPAGDYAGRLIEAAGLGGLAVGGARVSRRHHGFVVNADHASAQDVRALVERVQGEVERRFGVRLERELVYL